MQEGRLQRLETSEPKVEVLKLNVIISTAKKADLAAPLTLKPRTEEGGGRRKGMMCSMQKGAWKIWSSGEKIGQLDCLYSGE